MIFENEAFIENTAGENGEFGEVFMCEYRGVGESKTDALGMTGRHTIRLPMGEVLGNQELLRIGGARILDLRF